MALTVRLGGAQQLVARLNSISDQIRDEITDEINDTALRIRNRMLGKIMQGPKSGRVYQRGTVSHRASAPGEAPANDLGDLKNSLNPSTFINPHATRPEVTVGPPVEHGERLEYGTTKMAARPWFWPSVEEERPVFMGNITNILGDIL